MGFIVEWLFGDNTDVTDADSYPHKFTWIHCNWWELVWLLNTFALKKMVPRYFWYQWMQNFIENKISKILWNPLWGNFSAVVWNFELKYSNSAVTCTYFIYSIKAVMNSCNGKYRYTALYVFTYFYSRLSCWLHLKLKDHPKHAYLKTATNKNA